MWMEEYETYIDTLILVFFLPGDRNFLQENFMGELLVFIVNKGN